MQKFIAKPVVIEAMQFDGSHKSAQDIVDWVNNFTGYKVEDGGWPPILFYYGEIRIETVDGKKTFGGKSDWVVRGIDNKVCIYKAEIFEMMYEVFTEGMKIKREFW